MVRSERRSAPSPCTDGGSEDTAVRHQQSVIAEVAGTGIFYYHLSASGADEGRRCGRTGIAGRMLYSTCSSENTRQNEPAAAHRQLDEGR